jgi:hypothetical protein
VWVLSFGVPLWLAGDLDAGTAETMTACLMGLVLFPLVIPWGYAWKHYVAAPGAPWWTPAPPASAVPDAAA